MLHRRSILAREEATLALLTRHVDSLGVLRYGSLLEASIVRLSLLRRQHMARAVRDEPLFVRGVRLRWPYLNILRLVS